MFDKISGIIIGFFTASIIPLIASALANIFLEFTVAKYVFFFAFFSSFFINKLLIDDIHSSKLLKFFLLFFQAIPMLLLTFMSEKYDSDQAYREFTTLKILLAIAFSGSFIFAFFTPKKTFD